MLLIKKLIQRILREKTGAPAKASQLVEVPPTHVLIEGTSGKTYSNYGKVLVVPNFLTYKDALTF